MRKEEKCDIRLTLRRSDFTQSDQWQVVVVIEEKKKTHYV